MRLSPEGLIRGPQFRLAIPNLVYHKYKEGDAIPLPLCRSLPLLPLLALLPLDGGSRLA